MLIAPAGEIDDLLARGLAGEAQETHDKPSGIAALPHNKYLIPFAILPCCGAEGGRTFSDIGLGDEPLPSSWSVAGDESLILGFDYNALARDVVATAKIPRALHRGSRSWIHGLFVENPK